MLKTLFLSLIRDTVPPPHQYICGLQRFLSTEFVDKFQVVHFCVSVIHRIVPKNRLKRRRAQHTHTQCGQVMPFLAVFKHLSEVLTINFQSRSCSVLVESIVFRILSGEIACRKKAAAPGQPAGRISCLLFLPSNQ